MGGKKEPKRGRKEGRKEGREDGRGVLNRPQIARECGCGGGGAGYPSLPSPPLPSEGRALSFPPPVDNVQRSDILMWKDLEVRKVAMTFSGSGGEEEVEKKGRCM